MSWISVNIEWVMIGSGVLTASMILQALAPRYALMQTFGEDLPGPLGDAFARLLGFVIFLVGALLIYTAADPAAREPVLILAVTGKIGFIGLVLRQGSRWMKRPAALMVAGDSVMVALFVWYLAGA